MVNSGQFMEIIQEQLMNHVEFGSTLVVQHSYDVKIIANSVRCPKSIECLKVGAGDVQHVP